MFDQPIKLVRDHIKVLGGAHVARGLDFTHTFP